MSDIARRSLPGLVVAVATIVVLIALVVAPFFTPLWLYPAQQRAQADAWTGWPIGEVHAVTGSVLHDLFIGPPAFAQTVDGRPVFDAAERAHMRDVRQVLLAAVGVAVAAAFAWLAAWRITRGGPGFWGAVRTGAVALAAGVGVALFVAGVAGWRFARSDHASTVRLATSRGRAG